MNLLQLLALAFAFVVFGEMPRNIATVLLSVFCLALVWIGGRLAAATAVFNFESLLWPVYITSGTGAVVAYWLGLPVAKVLLAGMLLCTVIGYLTQGRWWKRERARRRAVDVMLYGYGLGHLGKLTPQDSPEERMMAIAMMENMKPDEVSGFIQLTPEEREVLIRRFLAQVKEYEQ